MANEKVYSIKINGVTESVTAVDSLNDALGMLEQRMKAVQSSTVSTGSNGGGGSRAKSLAEEDKLLKQIQKSEQDLINAQREEYQSLLANKDLIKQAKTEAESRAASERLAADNYANSMQGLKQQLADIKRVMQTEDLGSEKFVELTKDANELNAKLLEIEKSYGQWGRNVGNYPSAFEGVTTIKVTVGDTVREFNNAREASRQLGMELKSMAVNGQQGTKEFKDMQVAVAQLNSDIKDATVSSQAMDNMLDTLQSLGAIGQITQGFSSLMGFDDSEIERSIQKLVALQNTMQGLETLQQQMNSGEGIGGWISKGNAAIDKFVNWLFRAKTTTEAMATATKVQTVAENANKVATEGATVAKEAQTVAQQTNNTATTAGTVATEGLTKATTASTAATTASTVATKALGIALKGLGIGLIIAAITTAISLFSKFIDKQNESKRKAEEIKKAEQDAVTAYRMARTEIDLYIERIKSFNGTKNEEKALVEELNKKYGDTFGTFKTLSEWYKKLEKNSEDYCKQMENEIRLQLAREKLEDAYRKLDEAQTEKATWYAKLVGREKDVRQIKIQSAEKEVQAARENYKKIQNEIIAGQKAIGKVIKDNGKKNAKTAADVEYDIAQSRINAMKDGLTKTLAQLELERLKRIEEIKKTGIRVNEQITLANQEYEQKMFDARLQYHEKLLKEEEAYWEKVKQLQEKNYQQSVENSKALNSLRTEEKVNSLSPSFTDNYSLDYESSVVGQFMKKYNKDIVKVYVNNKTAIESLEYVLTSFKTAYGEGAETLTEFKAIQDRIEEIKQNMEGIREEYPDINWSEIESLKGITASFYDAYATRTTYRRQYNELANRLISEQNKKELELNKQKLDAEIKQELDAEEKRHKTSSSRIFDSDLKANEYEKFRTPNSLFKQYQEAIANGETLGMDDKQIGLYFSKYREALDEWIANLKTQLNEGKITYEEYFSIINSDLIKWYQTGTYELGDDLEKRNELFIQFFSRVEQEQSNHQNAMATIFNKGNIEWEKITRDNQKKLQNIQADGLKGELTEVEKGLNAINRTVDKKSVNSFGIINLGKEKAKLEDLKKTTDQVMADIARIRKNAEEKYNTGEINLVQKEAIDNQLNAVENQVKDTNMKIQQDQKNLVGDFIASAEKYIQAGVQAFQQIMDAVWSAQDAQFDKEQEALDKWNEELEKKLDEQQEIVEQHKDNINSIEDELATARGDRRQRLIDMLNAEIAAQRAAQAQEQVIEKQKETVEKKQEELDKKRKKAEYERNIIQAIVNGALAVTFAAINPWPVPAIPMMALAGATTAAQLAIMMANKPYEKGGQLDGGVAQGKRHRDGGIPVLGGRASIEGGEFITNRRTTADNVDLLEYINSKHRKLNMNDFIDFYGGEKTRKVVSSTTTKFADGGQVPTLSNDIDVNDRLTNAFEDYANRPIYVSVVDIQKGMTKVNRVKALAGVE